MNETVIEKISEQLGIAADKATQLLGQIIPQYAGMQAFNYFSIGLAFLIPSLFLLFAAHFYYKKIKNYTIPANIDRYDRRDKEEEKGNLLDAFWFFSFFGIGFLLFSIYNICNAVNWLCFSEAHIFQMVLNKF